MEKKKKVNYSLNDAVAYVLHHGCDSELSELDDGDECTNELIARIAEKENAVVSDDTECNKENAKFPEGDDEPVASTSKNTYESKGKQPKEK